MKGVQHKLYKAIKQVIGEGNFPSRIQVYFRQFLCDAPDLRVFQNLFRGTEGLG